MFATRRPLRLPIGSRVCLLLAALTVIIAGCTRGDAEPTATEGDQHRSEGHGTEEVSVAAEGLVLEGTLRLPAGAGPATGIVIAHGSGPSSRRGEMAGQLGLTFPAAVPVYEQLAEGLLDAGHAVLTFDKRTCGPFNACADNGYPEPDDDLTFATLVDDLDAVVEHLAERDDIAEVVVAGHSKGGTAAAQLAAQRDDLGALVLLATPAVGVPELLATQAATFRDLIDATDPSGQAGEQADRAVAGLESLADEVATVADGQVAGPELGGASRAFWASWIDAARTAPAAIRDADVPVLVLGGSNDWNVLPDQLEAWSPALDAERDELVLLPGITHALTRLDGDDPAEVTGADVGTVVDQRVIDTVATWLDDTAG